MVLDKQSFSLNKDLRRGIFVTILREIYSDTLLRINLGFKGGTAAMLFYALPRFSVDLDFDLLNPDKKEAVFARLKEILPSFGEVIETSDKHHTLLFVLRYKKYNSSLKEKEDAAWSRLVCSNGKISLQS